MGDLADLGSLASQAGQTAGGPLSALFNVGMGAIGNSKSAADRDNATNATAEANGDVNALKLPTFNTQLPGLPQYQGAPTAPGLIDSLGQLPQFQNLSPLQLGRYSSTGQMDPQMEQALSQGGTSLSAISTDPNTRNAQMQALQSLQTIGSQGGLNATDKSRILQLQMQNDATERQHQQALQQQMQARGMAGSGMELMQSMLNQQGGADRNAMQSAQIAADAQQRQQSAIMQAGQLGGQLHSQNYGEQANTARAQDAINNFNTANSQRVLGQNTDRSNNAQQYNLGASQRLSNANVDLGNQQQELNQNNTKYNNSMAQQGFANTDRAANFTNNARQQGYGDQYQNAGFNNNNATRNYDQGVGQVQYGNDMGQRGYGDASDKVRLQMGALGQLAGRYDTNAGYTNKQYAGYGNAGSTAINAAFGGSGNKQQKSSTYTGSDGNDYATPEAEDANFAPPA